MISARVVILAKSCFSPVLVLLNLPQKTPSGKKIILIHSPHGGINLSYVTFCGNLTPWRENHNLSCVIFCSNLPTHFGGTNNFIFLSLEK